MEAMIVKRLKIIDDLQKELNSLKENYQDMLEDDPVYQEIQEKDMEIKEEKRENKTRLMNNSTYQGLEEEMKDKRREIKEHKEALSVELVELYRTEGVTEVTDEEGKTKKMKFSVRLVNS